VNGFKKDKQVGDTGDDRKLTASTPGLLEIKQNGHTDTTVKKNLPEVNGDDANYEKAKDDTKISEITSDDEEDEQVRAAGVRSTGCDQTVPASSDIRNSEELKGRHTDASVKKNQPEVNGDDAKYEKARDDTNIPATSVTKIPEITSADKEDEQARESGAQSTGGDKMNPASSDIRNPENTVTSVKKNPPEVNGDDANYENAKDDTKIPVITRDDEEDEQDREAGVRILGDDAKYEKARDDAKYEKARDDAKYEKARDDAKYEKARDDTSVSSQSGKSVRGSNGNASAVSSQSGKPVQSSDGTPPPGKVRRRYKTVKRFICCLPVH
jgi:hypothetical protein